MTDPGLHSEICVSLLREMPENKRKLWFCAYHPPLLFLYTRKHGIFLRTLNMSTYTYFWFLSLCDWNWYLILNLWPCLIWRKCGEGQGKKNEIGVSSLLSLGLTPHKNVHSYFSRVRLFDSILFHLFFVPGIAIHLVFLLCRPRIWRSKILSFGFFFFWGIWSLEAFIFWVSFVRLVGLIRLWFFIFCELIRKKLRL